MTTWTILVGSLTVLEHSMPQSACSCTSTCDEWQLQLIMPNFHNAAKHVMPVHASEAFLA